MAKDWELMKDEIRDLYKVKNKTLDEVMRLMKGNHDFIASERSYRTQLQKWGYMKYNTENFQPNPRNRVKKRRRARTVFSTGLERLADVSASQATMATQFDPFNLPSMQTLSHAYPHGAESWHFGTPSENGSGAASNHYPAIAHTLAGIHLPSTSGNELSLDAQGADGRTQLHRAVIDGSVELMRTLLSTGAAVDVEDNIGNRPLHYAVLAGSVVEVKLLLRFGADYDCKGQLGRSPLHMSVLCDDILQVLLQTQAIISSQDERGDTPLHLALTRTTQLLVYAKEGAVQLLLDAGANTNLTNLAGVTPFHIIVNQLHQNGSKWKHQYLKVLLEAGADITLRTRDNKLPFEVFVEGLNDYWASSRYLVPYTRSNPDAISCLKLLLSKGADPNTRLRSGELLFHYHMQHSYNIWHEDVELTDLLCHGVDPCNIGGNGNYPLHEMCAQARVPRRKSTSIIDLIKIALSRGANPNQLNRSGHSLLMTLLTTKKNAERIVVEAVELLLASGADPMLQTASANLPLYEAVRRFPKVARDLGKKLLHAQMKTGDGAREPCNNGSYLTNDRLRWQNWELTVREKGWVGAKAWLCSLQSALPADVSKEIHSIALGVITEKCLEFAKDEFKFDSTELDEHRSYVAVILRDCRQLGIEADIKWFDYCLDLCK